MGWSETPIGLCGETKEELETIQVVNRIKK